MHICNYLCELVTNSVVHSDSRRDGGTITITLIAIPGGIRAEIIDDGGATVPSALRDPQISLLAEGGLGLQLVETLADRWSHWRDDAGTVTWFEMQTLSQPMQHSAVSGKGLNSPDVVVSGCREFGHGRQGAEKIVPGLGAELGSPVAFSHGLSVSARMPLTMRRRP